MSTGSRIDYLSDKRVNTDYDVFVEKDDITVVIPTLNEELAIGFVINELVDEGYYNILIVDGYSSDSTVEVAQSYGVPIISQHGKGKTGAIQTAIEHVKTSYLVVIDGDSTYDSKDIKKFLPHIRNYNQIIGTRTSGRKNISLLNRFGNWMINKLFNLFFGTKLTDVCSGLYCLKTEFAKGLVLESQGFDVEVEVAVQAADSGSLTEIPINYGKRLGQQKLRPLRDGFNIIMTILKLARIYNSVIFYSFLAAWMSIPSACILAWVALEWFYGTWHSGIALFGVMLTIISTEAIMMYSVVSQQKRVEQRILNKINLEK